MAPRESPIRISVTPGPQPVFTLSNTRLHLPHPPPIFELSLPARHPPYQPPLRYRLVAIMRYPPCISFIPVLHNLKPSPPPPPAPRALCRSPRHALVVPPSTLLPPRPAAKGARRARRPHVAVAAPSRNHAYKAHTDSLPSLPQAPRRPRGEAGNEAVASSSKTRVRSGLWELPQDLERQGNVEAAMGSACSEKVKVEADVQPKIGGIEVAVEVGEAVESVEAVKAMETTNSATAAKRKERGGRNGTAHRHTDESRRKISEANRGNVPWNKGRRHTEATKRKIAESTRRAMLRPEMRRLLKERALGRRHSEATKLKIRETARLTRATRRIVRKAKRVPVPFAFSPDAIADLNERVQRQLETNFEKDPEMPQKLVTREKRRMPLETREKLSMRIKEMWNDPEYRSKVEEGVERRARMLGTERSLSPRSRGRSSTIESESEGGSPRRKARSRPNKQLSVGEILEQESRSAKTGEASPRATVTREKSEFFLPSDSLQGFSKEDLGIFDEPVVSAENERSSIEVEENFGLSTMDEPEHVDTLREHENLLSSLADSRQVPFGDDSFDAMHTSTDGFDLPDLGDPSAAPLDECSFVGSTQAGEDGRGIASEEGTRLGDAGGQVGLPFFEGPVDLLASSSADFGTSPFVSVSSFGNVEELGSGEAFVSGKGHLDFSGEDNLELFENGAPSF